VTAPLETYLAELQRLRLTGVATEEISYYPPLQNLLNEIGRTLKPKVFCLSQPKNAGAGRPDFYLYTAGQLPKATTRSRPGRAPHRPGVLERRPRDDAVGRGQGADHAAHRPRHREMVQGARAWLSDPHERRAARLYAGAQEGFGTMTIPPGR